MELACELNDNDPWTLFSGAHYAALCGSIEQARVRAERRSRCRRRPPISNGRITARSVFSAATMPGPLRHATARKEINKILPAWRAAALFQLGEPPWRRKRSSAS